MDNKQKEYELDRLGMVMEQINSDLDKASDKVVSQRESLKEINKNMLSEFKFETEPMVDLEGAAVMHQYQSMGKNVENAMDYQMQRVRELTRLRNSAYFAKIVFKEDGEAEEEIYIGSSSLVKNKGFEYLIYDWRAPICSIFYDYEQGQVSYQAPAGEIKGELVRKRHFKIKNGELQYMFDSNINIMDDMLKEALAKSVDDKMKTIITTIQKEQNQVIRDESADVLVVSGSAGSGKTSIALHRIAYLLYRNRETIMNSDVLIFTPNDIFSDYISHVLPELGEQNVDSITFNDYIQQELGIYIPVKENQHQFMYGETREEGEEVPKPVDPVENKVLKCYWEEIESYYDQMEYLLSPVHDDKFKKRVDSMTRKSSVEFFDRFEGYISHIEARTDYFEDLYYGEHLLLSKEDMNRAYLDCVGVIKCSSRLKQVRNQMMERVKDMRKIVAYNYEQSLINADEYYTKSDIKRKTYKYLKRKFKPLHRKVKRMTSLDLLELYNDFLRKEGLETVNKSLEFEDALCLMYMKGRLDTIKEVHKVKYLFIDEAQDYTLLHYKIIALIFGHCKYTLLGDPNQAIHPYISSEVNGSVEDFLGDSPKHIRLTKTYRSTKQISDFCSKILPSNVTGENVLREGKEPEMVHWNNGTDGYKVLLDSVQQALNNGLRSVAVIGKTKAHCELLHEQLVAAMNDKNSDKDGIAQSDRDVKKIQGNTQSSTYDFELGLLNNEDLLYKTGVIVIPSYLAKGLEFDSVHVVTDDVFRYDAERERQLFYTVCTRALHELSLYEVNGLPKLLELNNI